MIIASNVLKARRANSIIAIKAINVLKARRADMIIEKKASK